ncbi:MAG: DsrE family protein [Chloroflexi bacterium]|nr:DsrE family protein [Chloroflexota bacterium]
MNALVILNDPPYGTERSYNGLRLALSLAKEREVELRLFLMADAVRCGQRGQETPEGYYNIERMLTGLRVKGVPIGACGTCMAARGMHDEALIEGAHRSSMAELTTWTLWADKVLSF